MLSDIHENSWYTINGIDYKCLSIVNHVGIFIEFEGMCETYKIRKFSLLKIIGKDDYFEYKDDILPIHKYKEISRHDDLYLVWSMYPQDENYFEMDALSRK